MKISALSIFFTFKLGKTQCYSTRFRSREGMWSLTSDTDSDGRILSLAAGVKVAPHPAILFGHAAIGRGMPNLGGTKMGAIRIRVANALHDRKMPLIVKRLEADKVRI